MVESHYIKFRSFLIVFQMLLSFQTILNLFKKTLLNFLNPLEHSLVIIQTNWNKL
jgi:hypothetical protein